MEAEIPKGYMIHILKKFQAWRLGEDERTLTETGLTPKLITEAIDFAIKELEKQKD